MDLSVILPSYLEEENLRLILPRIKSELEDICDDFEIIVVDTMTVMDGTQQVCEDLGITYLQRNGGNSYGDAIRSGIEKSSGDRVIFMDADGSHPPSFIRELYKCRNDAKIVIASRYIKGGYTENSKYLVLMSRMVNFGFSFVLGIKCRDISNSFKLYPGGLLRDLSLSCKNFDVVEEIIYKLIKKNPEINILEIPFSFKQRMFGETKRNLFLFILTYFFTLIKLRFFSSEAKS